MADTNNGEAKTLGKTTNDSLADPPLQPHSVPTNGRVRLMTKPTAPKMLRLGGGGDSQFLTADELTEVPARHIPGPVW